MVVVRGGGAWWWCVVVVRGGAAVVVVRGGGAWCCVVLRGAGWCCVSFLAGLNAESIGADTADLRTLSAFHSYTAISIGWPRETIADDWEGLRC